MLDLAQDTQEEFRRLCRMLSQNDGASFLELVHLAFVVQSRMETITAGAVLLARGRHITWEALGKILLNSPETARRSYHEDLVKRRIRNAATPSPAPTPQPQATDSEGEDDGPPPPLSPPARAERAANQLATVLSKMQRASGLPLRRIGFRTQVSASYLSRVLSGEKFPTWELTEKIAAVLGADSEALKVVWEHTARNRRSAEPPTPPPTLDGKPGPPPSAVLTGLRALHQRTASPSTVTLAKATGGRVSERDIRRILEGHCTGNWEQIETLIRAMAANRPSSCPTGRRPARRIAPASPRHPPAEHSGTGQRRWRIAG